MWLTLICLKKKEREKGENKKGRKDCKRRKKRRKSTHQEEVHFSIFLEERKRERKNTAQMVFIKTTLRCILNVKNGS